MKTCTFIHAADLHLDVPFQGLQALAGQSHTKNILPILQKATFTALDRLIDLCLNKNVDFLILAGDIYNSKASSLRARLALRSAFIKLQEKDIKVFLAHGNHDPLTAETNSISWPDNVQVFTGEPSSYEVFRKGELIAVVQGLSHVQDKENRNLAALFTPKNTGGQQQRVMHIGVLHCALSGKSGQHAAYAPCNISDLQNKGIDYWALGHVHVPTLASLDTSGAYPFYAYSGSLQGLHVNETGAHGCFLVQTGTTPKFVPLAPVVWHNIAINLETLDNDAEIPDLEELILSLVHEATGQGQNYPKNGLNLPKNNFTQAKDNLGQAEIEPKQAETEFEQVEQSPVLSENCAALANTDQVLGKNLCAQEYPVLANAIRLVLTGRSPLHQELRHKESLVDLQDYLNQSLHGSNLWIRDIKSNTRPYIEMDELRQSQDMLGEILRITQTLSTDPEQLAASANKSFAPLQKNAKIQSFLPEQKPEELLEVLALAETLCLDLLEDK